MNNNNENKLVPKLRFPEFLNEEEWEEDIVDNLVLTITPPKKLSSSNYRLHHFIIFYLREGPKTGELNDFTI